MKQRIEPSAPPIELQDLTQSQLLMWAGQELSPKAPLYNMVLAFQIKGRIQESHFQAAFQALVNSSDAMRLVFRVENGVPKQQILPSLDYQLEILDWSEDPSARDKFEDWATQRSQQPFDLSKLAFDAVLVKLAADRFVWFFNQHHLITDAWSVAVLYKKMATLYEAAISRQLDESGHFPPFLDYIQQEKVARQTEKKLAIQKYWQDKAKELPAPPALYGFTSQASTSRSQRVSIDLGEMRSARLRALAQEADVRSWTPHLTLFNIFATTVFAFLHKVSGQENIALGAPAHNRLTPVLKETPGVFIEIYPVSTAISEADSFGSLLQKVKTETNTFFRYAQSGGANPSLSRGFNVILNYINAAFTDFNDMPMQSDWIHPQHCDPRHHLRIQVHDMDASGNIQLHFDLNEDVFDAATRKLLPAHFTQLLDAFVKDRSQLIQATSLVTEAEAKVLTGKVATGIFNGSFPNIVAGIEEQVAKTPQTIALRYGEQTLDYQTFNEKANQLAHYLQETGIGKGQRVGLYMPRSPELLIGILGILKTGAAYVPIATEYPAERVAFMVEDAQLALLISSESAVAQLDTIDIPVLALDHRSSGLDKYDKNNLNLAIGAADIAYLMYTSGSTGRPKGVMVGHRSLAQYISWASDKYITTATPQVPLFTSIGFDLTVTSLFLPFVNGGSSVIYEEANQGPDLAIFQVLAENKVDFIKLTPSHLALLKDKDYASSKLQTMIVGGEDFKTNLAYSIQSTFGADLRIYNEYGPTEATVGCIIHAFDSEKNPQASVPIGKASVNTQAYLLNKQQQLVPQGVVGEIYLAGQSLALGYWNRPELTAERFVGNPFVAGAKMYRTGDLARLNADGNVEYLGRVDHQVKLNGRRVELGEIESVLEQYPGIKNSVVVIQKRQKGKTEDEICNCVKCGLPTNYPNISFDEKGVCQLCNAFESYQQKVQKYFRTPDDLQALFQGIKPDEKGEYDCLMLLSGGKDSTYALSQLVEMGLKVLTFTLDNGYISDQAKANIRRVVDALGVDHVFGETPAMNEIFVDSLKRFCNVCDGCFKTIYTLSIKLALEKKIPYIVTGLSRGQFFETRLTEELFLKDNVDMDGIDETILQARKAYHRADDAIKRLLDTSMFEDDEIFEKVQFVDFYRFTDVSLAEMLEYLDNRLPWVRPTDTGRSTNCLINQAGIFVHKKERGYSNYAFPYSWDVRVGHKTRDASLDEINEEIDEIEVQRILQEIGYTQSQLDIPDEDHYLMAYYVADEAIEPKALHQYLSERLPAYMIPSQMVVMEVFPLTPNGKIDRAALPSPDAIPATRVTAYAPPENEIEEILVNIWEEVLHLEQVGRHDNFIELGGNSLAAIRVMARINEALELEIPLNRIFESPTIAGLSAHIEGIIVEMLDAMGEE